MSVNVRWEVPKPTQRSPSLHFIEGAWGLRGRRLAKDLVAYAQAKGLRGVIDFHLLNPLGGELYVGLYGTKPQLYELIHWLADRFPWLDPDPRLREIIDLSVHNEPGQGGLQ